MNGDGDERPVTIRDVARAAGVAPSTVSYVMNNSGAVSPETRARVSEAVRRLNYRPNAVARGLRTRESLTIGLIVVDISNPFFAEVARGVEDCATSYDYAVVLCSTCEDVRRETRYLQLLESKRVDGLILVSTGHRNEYLLRMRTPVVMVDRAVENVDGYSVLVDNVAGGYNAAKHLLEQGCRNITLITGPPFINTYRERLMGVKNCLKERGVPDSALQVETSEVSVKGGYETARQLVARGVLVRRGREAPAGVFATNDLIALGVLRALQELGFQIPGDAALVGYDDIPAASMVKPALSSVSQPKYEMGASAVKMLLKLLSGRNVRRKVVTLAPTLIVRESSSIEVRLP